MKHVSRLGLLLLPMFAAASFVQAAPQESYDWQNVTIKGNGFVNGILYSPLDPNLIYVHTDIGGAYRWDADIGRWSPLNDWSKWNDWPAQNMGVETIALDPTNADRVYMSIGTYNSPAAIMRSTDRGKTWQRTDTPIRANGNGIGRSAGQRLQVDPNSPNILYYGTRLDGLWRSTDFGATWNQVTSFPILLGTTSGTYTGSVGLVWTLIDKSSGSPGSPSQVIYVGSVHTDPALNHVFRSTDGGSTWAVMPGDQPTALTRYAVRALLTPDGSAMYVNTCDVSPGPYGIEGGAVYKITNPASASPLWAQIPQTDQGSDYLGDVGVVFNAIPGYAGSFPGGYGGVALDPTDPNIVYVTTLNRYTGSYEDVIRSTDGGATWARTGLASSLDASSAPDAQPFGIHWVGDLQINPHNRNDAMINTGYGVFRTSDLTATTPAWHFFDEGLEETAALELVSPNSGDVYLFSAIGDRDGFRHEDFTESPILGTFGQPNAFGQTDNLSRGTSTDVSVGFNDALQLVRVVNATPFVQYSMDNGITWTWMPGAPPSNATSGGAIELNIDGTIAVWEPGGQATIRYATRSGSTWSAWQTPVTTTANNVRVAADLVNPNAFYAYGNNSVWRSLDGGVNWGLQTNAPGVGGRPGWLRAVPNHEGHLLASFGGNGAWRSTDGGATWSRLNATSVTTANVIGVGAAAPGKSYPAIYVGGTVDSRTGFFRSEDEGASWTEISDDAHQWGFVTVIQGDPRVYGRLYIGANGRGVLWGDTTLAARVRHAPTINGSHVEGSLQVMLPENVTFNSGATITRDLLVPGTPTVDVRNSATYGGTIDGLGAATPTNGRVTLNKGVSLQHVVRRSDPSPLPVVAPPPQPTGTRSVSLNNPGQDPGDFATIRNLTLNSKAGAVAVPPGTYGSFNANSGSSFVLGVAGATTPAIYNFQNLTLNSGAKLDVVGPVIVLVNGGFSTGGQMGVAAHPEWLVLRIAGGGLSLNSNASVWAYVEAPDGTITLNSHARLIGSATCDRLILNSSSWLGTGQPN